MTTYNSARAMTTPRVAVDPGLPEEAKTFLRRLDPVLLRSASTPVPDVTAPGLLRSAFRPLRKLAGLMLGTVALCPIFATLYSEVADLSYWAALRSLLWGCALFAVLGFWVVIAVTNERMGGRHRSAQLLKESHGRYLGPAEFMPDAAMVLVRVQAATDSILGSELQEQGLLDRDLNLTGLPAFEWEIAQALAAYSREVMSLPAWPAGEKAARVLDAGRAGLGRRLEGITDRVALLEQYAVLVTMAGISYREREQLRGLGNRDGAAEEVLAMMARDSEASVISELDQAVAAAREAGTAALKRPA
ncbi:hypothetical protein ACFUTY_19820 [Streptomyces sp. NPDC057362]|uniref:hypothetical protein n=1 Tax=Streptomyces sp. NPDC057362 TaxID=3346106 RepID=UPI00363C4604